MIIGGLSGMLVLAVPKDEGILKSCTECYSYVIIEKTLI